MPFPPIFVRFLSLLRPALLGLRHFNHKFSPPLLEPLAHDFEIPLLQNIDFLPDIDARRTRRRRQIPDSLTQVRVP